MEAGEGGGRRESAGKGVGEGGGRWGARARVRARLHTHLLAHCQVCSHARIAIICLSWAGNGVWRVAMACNRWARAGRGCASTCRPSAAGAMLSHHHDPYSTVGVIYHGLDCLSVSLDRDDVISDVTVWTVCLTL